jgi:hypothetical protein
MKYKLAAILCAALAGCGGGSSDPLLVASADAVVPTNAAVASSVAGTSFAFPTGVAALGTTGTTTVAFSGTAASPGFAVGSGGNTASGSAAFGSCIFAVTSSTFPAGHPLSVGQTVTVNPCSLNVNTTGALANGQATSRSVALVLGAAASANASVTVGVSSNGSLTLNGNIVTTVVLTPVSG